MANGKIARHADKTAPMCSIIPNLDLPLFRRSKLSQRNMFVSYVYELPKYFRNSKVAFNDHSNNERVGIVGEVQTNYDQLNIAHHFYLIIVEGNINRIRVSQDKILYCIS